ncbi:MAG: FtsQ-type POTRA domain-containing protein [Chitinivibrionales bacterium]|nr:FtsQ-type POTRA domain-containing protein [Chitinivibrionales bacterium]MBD3394254.1 FtsQ-type POTRA domain-containing protein [Chitinivibrionales bacterium]
MNRRVGANRRKKMRERREKLSRPPANSAARMRGAAKAVVLATLLGTGAFFAARRAAAWVNTSNLFVLENIRVCGVALLDTSDVLSLANLAPGTHLAKLDVGGVIERLAANPAVEKVRVRRRLPNTVDIVVQERRPRAMVNLGRVHLVDRQGVLLPLVAGKYANTPIVSGLRDTIMEDGTRRLTARSLSVLNSFLDGVREARPEIASRLSQVQFDAAGNAKFVLEASATVVEIDAGNVRRRIEQLHRLLRARERHGCAPAQTISLRYANLAFVR